MRARVWKASIVSGMLAILMICLLMPVQVEARKSEILFAVGNPFYPEQTEFLGITIYMNTLLGRIQTHPSLKDKFRLKAMDKGTLFSNQNDALEAISMGTLHLTYSGPHFLEALYPAWKLLEAPGVIEDWAHFMRVLDTPAWKELENKMAKDKGVKILKWAFDTGTWFIFTSKGPINVAADFKGQKIRYPGGAAFSKALAGLGVTGVAVPYTEVVTGLQTKMFNGVLTDFPGGMGFYELDRYTKYAVLIPVAIQPICIIVNTKWWESLSPVERDALNAPFERIDMEPFFRQTEGRFINEWRNNPKLELCQPKKEEIVKVQRIMKDSIQGVISDVDPKYIQAIDSVR